jgi:hypothetical protein
MGENRKWDIFSCQMSIFFLSYIIGWTSYSLSNDDVQFVLNQQLSLIFIVIAH